MAQNSQYSSSVQTNPVSRALAETPDWQLVGGGAILLLALWKLVFSRKGSVMDAYERGFEGYSDDGPDWGKAKSYQKYATETIALPSDDEVEANRERRRQQLEEFERKKQADDSGSSKKAGSKQADFSTGPVPELHPFLDSKGENKVDPEVIKERLNRRRLS